MILSNMYGIVLGPSFQSLCSSCGLQVSDVPIWKVETTPFNVWTLNSHSKRAMATSRRLFNLCSLLMATLFAYSASVQLNDPDWYFWFPLYSCACFINLPSCMNKTIIATIVLWVGVLLCTKVVLEDFVYEIAGFMSLDLSERVVREKIGSILVIISTILQMEASNVQNHTEKNKGEKDISRIVKYGMLILVVFSYMLPFVFFVVLKGEMKF